MTMRFTHTDPVMAPLHRRSGQSKATWTGADSPDIGWRDCRVHSISVGEYGDDSFPPTRMLMDLDYIVRWVEPVQ
jgi:hypothetical protein